ncbi:hypothetical protein GR140_31860 (plasmid) [Pseudomonas putida]|uniref:hypothetical protein n=1 Tax=Pseudomonas putida TaxID=303 RepID=UPI001BAF1070|nr:hypothetical protein [Pseudomonas putida]QUG93338.1 hypothetical protein GR140_31860 [Pseudomonas putida]
MSGLTVVCLVILVAVIILWRYYGAVKKKAATPRQEPSVDRRDDVEDNLFVSPVTAARTQAAQSKPAIPVGPVKRGATRVSAFPPPVDYEMYDSPAFLRKGVALSFSFV